MPNPFVHFEIIGKDQQLLESFSKDVFGWKITAMMEGYSLVDTRSKPGSGTIAGFLDPEDHLIGLVQPPPGM